MIRRCVLLAAVLCLALTAACADPSWAWSMPAETLWRDTLEAEITLHADTLQPLGTERLDSLNALLRHLRLTLFTAPMAGGGRHYGLRADVDGESCAALTVTDTDSDLLLGLPGRERPVRLSEDEAPLEAFLPGAAASWDLMMFPDLWLNDADAALDRLLQTGGPEEKKDRQTIRDNFGKTTRRLTVRRENAADFAALLAACCPDGFLGEFLRGLTFVGAQEVYALCRDDGFTVKAVYQGAVRTSGGQERQIQVEWKRIREDASVRDMLTCKTPGKTETMKFTFDRRAKLQQGAVKIEIKDCTLTALAPDGGQYRLSVEPFTVTPGADVKIVLKESSVKGKKATPLRSLTLTPAAERDGDTVLIGWQWRDTEEDLTWSGTLRLTAGTAVPVPDSGEAPAAYSPEMLDEAGAIFGSRVLAALVLLPEEADTSFLRDGLSDEAWEAVRNQAMLVLNRQGGVE